MSDIPSRAAAGRIRRPVDRRDEAVGATLVGLVVVLLGFASGIGAGGGTTAVAGGGQAPGIGGPSSGAPTPAGPPAIIQASSSSSAAAGGDQYPPPGDTQAGPNQSSAPTSAGATSGPVAGPTSPLPSTPMPTPLPTPTSVISQSPYPTSIGSSPSDPSSPDGSPSTPPPVVISGDPSTTPAPDVLSCLLDPITAPLGGLLGLGNLLGPCPNPTGGPS